MTTIHPFTHLEICRPPARHVTYDRRNTRCSRLPLASALPCPASPRRAFARPSRHRGGARRCAPCPVSADAAWVDSCRSWHRMLMLTHGLPSSRQWQRKQKKGRVTRDVAPCPSPDPEATQVCLVDRSRADPGRVRPTGRGRGDPVEQQGCPFLLSAVVKAPCPKGRRRPGRFDQPRALDHQLTLTAGRCFFRFHRVFMSPRVARIDRKPDDPDEGST
jgi:hypothetical protein